MRLEALADGREVPASVYEVRDEWMARSIARVAGLRAGRRRKTVVWLHNDHARYGAWDAGAARVRSTGQFLRDQFPGQVFSIGMFMGAGTFADNFRRVRQVAPSDTLGLEGLFARAGHRIGWLLLAGARDPRVGRWAAAVHTYSRGDLRARMRPGEEFDALVYFDSVSPPSYIR
jgi:erythromycin esterase-like protein